MEADTSQLAWQALKALPMVIVAVALVLQRLGYDVERPERQAARTFADEFLEVEEQTPDQVTGGRSERFLGTPPSVHFVLIALFLGAAIAGQVAWAPDALGRAILAVVTLGPCAGLVWSLVAIERLSITRDALEVGRWRGPKRVIRYEDVSEVILRIDRVEQRGLGTGLFTLEVEASGERTKVADGKDCLLVASLFPAAIRCVENRFTQKVTA